MWIVGLLVGLVFATLLFVYLMRRFMVKEIELKGGFQEACRALEEAVEEAQGWGQPIPAWEFYKSQISKGLTYDNIKNLKIFFVCKPSHANRIVRKFPFMSAMMPCSWSVYEKTDGKVILAKMNIGLMSKVFLGNLIGTVMGEVAREEEAILEGLFRRLESASGEKEKEGEKREESPEKVLS